MARNTIRNKHCRLNVQITELSAVSNWSSYLPAKTELSSDDCAIVAFSAWN